MQAYEWRLVVTRSAAAWTETISALESLPQAVDPKASSLSVVIQGDEINLFHNYNTDTQTALRRLKARLSKPRASERKPRVNRNGPNSVCDDCGKTFHSPHYLNIHLQNSAQKEACLVCGLITIRGQALRDHLHAVHNQHFYVCPECPILLKSEAEVQKHVKKAHKAGVHTCRDCGRTFPRASSFEAHSQMHAVRTCRVCEAQFANRACYREHRAQCEPDAKPNKGLVRRDQRSNIRDPAVYICDHCGKTYLSRPQLKNHILWIHMNVRPHQCQWCGKRFYTSARLLEHSVVHTRERNFACEICGAKLVTKMALVYHTRRHTGEKPYECTDCGEKFLSASRRSEHRKRRHGKGAMFHCTLCTNYFVRGHELRKHMEKVHRKDTASSVATKIEIEETLHKDQSDKITICFEHNQ